METADPFHDMVIKTAAFMILARHLFLGSQIDRTASFKRSKKRGEHA
jgi:hypothetical protein